MGISPTHLNCASDTTFLSRLSSRPSMTSSSVSHGGYTTSQAPLPLGRELPCVVACSSLTGSLSRNKLAIHDALPFVRSDWMCACVHDELVMVCSENRSEVEYREVKMA